MRSWIEVPVRSLVCRWVGCLFLVLSVCMSACGRAASVSVVTVPSLGDLGKEQRLGLAAIGRVRDGRLQELHEVVGSADLDAVSFRLLQVRTEGGRVETSVQCRYSFVGASLIGQQVADACATLLEEEIARAVGEASASSSCLDRARAPIRRA